MIAVNAIVINTPTTVPNAYGAITVMQTTHHGSAWANVSLATIKKRKGPKTANNIALSMFRMRFAPFIPAPKSTPPINPKLPALGDAVEHQF